MDTRIFVSKKDQFRVESDSLCNELKTSLDLDSNLSLTQYNIYDIFNADENDIQLLKENVCSEVVTDTVFDKVDLSNKAYLAYEYLPGQYDQRADSAMQCLMLLNNKKTVRIHSGTLLVFDGQITDEQLDKVTHYLVNP
ncbi:MAG: phosphoribosylformylglycinamidine synthase, partial [Floccifex sp.]